VVGVQTAFWSNQRFDQNGREATRLPKAIDLAAAHDSNQSRRGFHQQKPQNRLVLRFFICFEENYPIKISL